MLTSVLKRTSLFLFVCFFLPLPFIPLAFSSTSIPKQCLDTFKTDEKWRNKAIAQCEAACAESQDLGLGNFDCPFATLCENFCRSPGYCQRNLHTDARWQNEQVDCVTSCIATQKRIVTTVACDWSKACQAHCHEAAPAGIEQSSLRDLCKKFLASAVRAMKRMKALGDAFAACGKNSISIDELNTCAERRARQNLSVVPGAFKDLTTVAYTDPDSGVAIINTQDNPIIREGTSVHEKVHLEDVRRWMADYRIKPNQDKSTRRTLYRRFIFSPSVIAETEKRAYLKQTEFLEQETDKISKKCKKEKSP